jgi:hypothetical protein
VAQLGARLNGIQKVRGSNPLGSTKDTLVVDGGIYYFKTHEGGDPLLGHASRKWDRRLNNGMSIRGPVGLSVNKQFAVFYGSAFSGDVLVRAFYEKHMKSICRYAARDTNA